jgi:hypothetical protein
LYSINACGNLCSVHKISTNPSGSLLRG